MDHTVHVVDLLRWMTGCEIVSVHAEKGNLRGDLAVEDLGLLSCELSDGTVATLDGSWAAHWEHTVAITDAGPWVLTVLDEVRL